MEIYSTINANKTSTIINTSKQKQTEDNTTTYKQGCDIYAPQILKNINIFSQYEDSIKKIASKSIKNQVENFVFSFRKNLSKINNNKEIQSNLNKINFIVDDDFVLLEWNYNHFRIGFQFETDEKNSNYYFVSDNKITSSYESKSDLMPQIKYDDTINSLIDFVIKNT